MTQYRLYGVLILKGDISVFSCDVNGIVCRQSPRVLGTIGLNITKAKMGVKAAPILALLGPGFEEKHGQSVFMCCHIMCVAFGELFLSISPISYNICSNENSGKILLYCMFSRFFGSNRKNVVYDMI